MQQETRIALERLFQAAVAAVDPRRLVSEWLERHNVQPSAVVAAGKAASAMAFGVADALGPVPGLVITNRSTAVPAPMELIVAGHPVPNEASLLAGARALELAGQLSPPDHLLVLISGGASALLEALRAGVTLPDLVATTELLLRSGADIESVNAIRRGLSRIKGGGLARAAASATVTTLAISDVISEDPSIIGSGPTVGVPEAESGLRVAERLAITDELPSTVRRVVGNPVPAGSPALDRYTILASGATAAEAAAAAARAAGRTASVVTTQLAGEARVTAVSAIARARRRDQEVCVFAGETTVTVTGSGSGGRNQEAALAAAIDLEASPGLSFLAAGTDGIDGPTTAAGAIVDSTTTTAMRGRGIDPAAALHNNDAGTALGASDALLITGDTGTNVGDIWITTRT